MIFKALYLLFLLSTLQACGHKSAAGEKSSSGSMAQPNLLHYEVRIASDLAQLEAHLCFTGTLPTRLLSGVKGGIPRLRDVALIGPDGEERPLPLTARGDALDMSNASANDCVSYVLRLDDVGWDTDTTRLFDTGLYLLRPPRSEWGEGTLGYLRFSAAPEVALSVPFTKVAEDQTYRVDRGAFQYMSRTALGSLGRATVPTRTCDVEISTLGELDALQEAALREQVTAAVEQVAAVSGAFPASQLQVVIATVGRSYGAPIRFGQVTRGGGAGVLLLVGRDARPEALRSDWTAFHELSHLMVPFVRREDAWLSEGIATYYQELLRVRAGMRTPEQALQRLYDGSARSRRALDVTLTEESRMMMEHTSFSEVYWGGAAFAFALDVALREESGGEHSLDSALRKLVARRPYDAPPISARDLLRLLGTVTDSQLPLQLAQDYAERRPAADLSAPLAALGVSVTDSELHLDDERRPLRDSLFAQGEHTGAVSLNLD